MTENDESNDSSSYEDVSENEENADSKGNAAWADSIVKILNTGKPKKKKTLVLSKAKKLNSEKVTKPARTVQFEIEAANGEIKKEILENEPTESTPKPAVKKAKQLPKARVKPNVLEKDKERLLSRIATKGVVQLFNAVRTQQKDIDARLREAGPLEAKKDKVMRNIDKRDFLDMLRGERPSDRTDSKGDAGKEGGTWNVLRDDFMMTAKMKDWDKEMELEEERIVESE